MVMYDKALFKKIYKIFIGDFSLLILRLIAIFYIAKNSGVNDAGLFTTLMAWASIISMFSMFGGYNTIQKYSEDVDKCREQSNIVILNFTLLTLALTFPIAFLFFKDNLIIAITIIVFESLALSMKSTARALIYSRGGERLLYTSNFITLLGYLIAIYFILLSVKIENKIMYYVVFYNAITIVLNVYIFHLIVGVNVGRPDFRKVISFYKESYLFLFSSYFRNLYLQLDKVLINYFWGNEVSGVYNICSRAAIASMLPINIYIQLKESYFYNKVDTKIKKLNSMYAMLKFATLKALILAFGSLIPIYIISSFLDFGESIKETYPYFIPYLITFPTLYIPLSYLNGVGEVRFRLTLMFVSCLLCVIFLFSLNYFSFKDYKLAPLGLFIINIFLIVWFYVKCRK